MLNSEISFQKAFILLFFFWQPQNESVDAQMVRQVVVQAIKKCM